MYDARPILKAPFHLFSPRKSARDLVQRLQKCRISGTLCLWLVVDLGSDACRRRHLPHPQRPNRFAIMMRLSSAFYWRFWGFASHLARIVPSQREILTERDRGTGRYIIIYSTPHYRKLWLISRHKFLPGLRASFISSPIRLRTRRCASCYAAQISMLVVVLGERALRGMALRSRRK